MTWLDLEVYEVGEFVKYHNRYAKVIESYIIENEFSRKIVRLYFLDSDKEVILDQSLISKLTDYEYEKAMVEFQNLCDCGEKHTQNPTNHSEWCKTLKKFKGEADENNVEVPETDSSKISGFVSVPVSSTNN